MNLTTYFRTRFDKSLAFMSERCLGVHSVKQTSHYWTHSVPAGSSYARNSVHIQFDNSVFFNFEVNVILSERRKLF